MDHGPSSKEGRATVAILVPVGWIIVRRHMIPEHF